MAGITTPVSAPNAYANKDDLTLYWKAPTGDGAREDYILKMASNRLRQMALDVSKDLDALVNANEVYFLNVQGVVMEAAKRALLADTDKPAAETWSQTAGPYSENFKYSNPAGDLYFKKAELQLIGLYGIQTLSSISTSQDLYGYSIYSS